MVYSAPDQGEGYGDTSASRRPATVDASAPVASVLTRAHRRLRPCSRVRPSPAACRGAQARRARSIPAETAQSGPQADVIDRCGGCIRSGSRVPHALASCPASTIRHRAILEPERRLVQLGGAAGMRRETSTISVSVISSSARDFRPCLHDITCQEIWTFSKDEAPGGRAPRTAETFLYPPVKSMA